MDILWFSLGLLEPEEFEEYMEHLGIDDVVDTEDFYDRYFSHWGSEDYSEDIMFVLNLISERNK